MLRISTTVGRLVLSGERTKEEGLVTGEAPRQEWHRLDRGDHASSLPPLLPSGAAVFSFFYQAGNLTDFPPPIIAGDLQASLGRRSDSLAAVDVHHRGKFETVSNFTRG
jgi:hypothetical protein